MGNCGGLFDPLDLHHSALSLGLNYVSHRDYVRWVLTSLVFLGKLYQYIVYHCHLLVIYCMLVEHSKTLVKHCDYS